MLVNLVRTARLELAQLSPLPPQDSVSTNFTTSAYLWSKKHEETLQFFAFRTVSEFTLKFGCYRPKATAYCLISSGFALRQRREPPEAQVLQRW